jgi:hypothetical protein
VKLDFFRGSKSRVVVFFVDLVVVELVGQVFDS